MDSMSNKPVINALRRALADTYALQVKAQNYHWNVTGPDFYGLHKLFEEQYDDAAEAVDELAERIRALGDKAPGSFKAFQQLTGVGDPVDGAGPETMIADLQASHETVSKALGEGIDAAEQAEDPVTADLFTERRAAHDKHAWMLRSHLA
jgi:starvation-inducible DNA-binding protein